MIAFYPGPKLLQCMTTLPNALWGVERFSSGYSGFTVRVRRASDSAVLDCKSQADLVAFCAGTNGFVHTFYDQSGNTRDLTQSTTSKQPKIFDSVTGLRKFGSTPAAFFDGTDDYVERTDNCGLPTGSPALTTVLMTGTLPAPASSCHAFAVGPDTSSGDCWYAGRSPTSPCFASFRGPFRAFSLAVDPASTPTYFVIRKALNAVMADVVVRQGKSTLTQTALTAGSQVLAAGRSRLGCGMTSTPANFTQETVALLAHWNAELAGVELDALEQVCERLRVQ